MEKITKAELVIVGTNDKFPFEMDKQVQPCSIDLRLDNKFYKFKDDVYEFDISDIENIKNYFSYFEIRENEKITLQPNEVLFGQIYEQLRIPTDCSGMIEGRSRFARLGLSVHATGGFINPEFEGAMPLQIINNNKIPITIYPYINICQLILIKLTSPPRVPYPRRSNNPYYKETTASLSVLNRDSEFINKNRINRDIEKRLLDSYYKEMEYRELHQESRINSTTNITNTIVECINNGIMEANKIDISTQQLKQNNKNDIAESIQIIKDAILRSNELNNIIKNDVLEQLTEISEQAKRPKEKRKQSIIKLILNKIGNTLASVESLAKVWDTWGTNIIDFFN